MDMYIELPGVNIQLLVAFELGLNFKGLGAILGGQCYPFSNFGSEKGVRWFLIVNICIVYHVYYNRLEVTKINK